MKAKEWPNGLGKDYIFRRAGGGQYVAEHVHGKDFAIVGPPNCVSPSEWARIAVRVARHISKRIKMEVIPVHD